MPMIGEIRMFAGSFAPAGWAFCEGQFLAVSDPENDALFQLIGTTYGGDGESTFALPDLRGRVPIHQEQGLGLSDRVLGENGGVEAVTLTTQQIPVHAHPLLASTDPATDASPAGTVFGGDVAIDLYGSPALLLPMSNQMVVPAGGSQPHENMQPFLCIHFIIALAGVFPTAT